MDKAGENRPPLTDDELRTVFQVVAAGRNQETALRHLRDRNRTTVYRAYNVVSHFERLGLVTLDDAAAQQVANAAGYGASIHYVENVFLRWKAWKAESPLAAERKDRRLDGQGGETGSEQKYGEPYGLLSVPRDPELGPHGRELFYFGRRFRDWPFISSLERLLAPVVDTGAVDLIQAADQRSLHKPAQMWRGREGRGAMGRKVADAEGEGVEQEWGLVLYDARVHSLYDCFRQHLQGHPCMPLMDIVERERTAYLEEVQMWWADERGLRAAYEDVRRAIQEFQHSLRAYPNTLNKT